MPESSDGSRSWKDFEREGWHQNAPGYDDRAGRMTTVAVGPLLEAVKAASGMRLLDVCCGPGYVAGAAAARGLTAIGIDIAPAMIADAQERFPSAEFHQGDAEALDFPDAAFNAVVCAFGLLHLSDAERAIAEARRVLKPGGLYGFTVWCQPDAAHLLGLALKAITHHADMSVPLPPAPPMFKYSDPTAGRSALEEAGFRDIESEMLAIEFRGRTPADVFDWFDKSTVRTMALFRLQSPEVQERIKAQILNDAEAYLTDGELRIPCPAMLYHGRKQ